MRRCVGWICAGGGVTMCPLLSFAKILILIYVTLPVVVFCYVCTHFTLWYDYMYEEYYVQIQNRSFGGLNVLFICEPL